MQPVSSSVCLTIIANTPSPCVHFTHDVAHLLLHLSGPRAVMRGRRGVDRRAEPVAYGHVPRCHGFWRNASKLNGQEPEHMAVRIVTCQHFIIYICNSSSGILSRLLSYFLFKLCRCQQWDVGERRHCWLLSVEVVQGFSVTSESCKVPEMGRLALPISERGLQQPRFTVDVGS